MEQKEKPQRRKWKRLCPRDQEKRDLSIAKDFDTGNYTQKQLAEKYRVDPMTILASLRRTGRKPPKRGPDYKLPRATYHRMMAREMEVGRAGMEEARMLLENAFDSFGEVDNTIRVSRCILDSAVDGKGLARVRKGEEKKEVYDRAFKAMSSLRESMRLWAELYERLFDNVLTAQALLRFEQLVVDTIGEVNDESREALLQKLDGFVNPEYFRRIGPPELGTG